jgi:hypothetical protein
MGAEVARYLPPGLAVNTSMYARARHPCRSRSDSKVPHTLCAVRNHSGAVSDRCSLTPASVVGRAYISESTIIKFTHRGEGVWSLFQDRTRQEVMFRMNGMPRAQEAHDCRDAGGRATQEQLPRSGLFQIGTVQCKSRPNPQRGFASHIPVLYRKVPFILNITACPETGTTSPWLPC